MIEVAGLELRGYHGALEEERERGQRFLFDVELVIDDRPSRTDELGDTVDYRPVVECVREVSDARRFTLLEALAGAIADALLARFPSLRRVRVRVRKPEVRLEPPAAYTAASVERSRA